MKNYCFSALLALFVVGTALQCNAQEIDYFGQTPPLNNAEIFAKGVISLEGRYEQNIVFSPDGKECVLVLSAKDWEYFKMYRASYRNNAWSEFEQVPFSRDVSMTLEPFFTSDSQKMYFSSNATSGTNKWDTDIWRLDTDTGVWSNPKRLGSNVNQPGKLFGQTFPSVSDAGNLYYVGYDADWNTDIYMAEKDGDTFKEPVKLSNAINSEQTEWDPLIAPDETYLIFAARRRKDTLTIENDPFGGQDLYVSFKEKDGSWGQGIHLAEVSTQDMEHAPSISPDGKYLFFGRMNPESWDGDMYWIPMTFLDKYRPASAVKKE